MKGLIRRGAAALGYAAVLAGAGGCYGYRDVVDPCYPQRYEYQSRQEVMGALAAQVHNGHVLDQTVWNYQFEPGTDRLTLGGLDHLAYLARRRPHPDPVVYLQTSQDVPYDPANPDQLVERRQELDAKRVAAVQKYLNAQAAASGTPFQVMIHDPSEVGLSSVAVNSATQQMLNTRFRGGLSSGTGGAGATGGGGTGAPK